ncbi:YkyB family protein [Bacillus sp. 165]|uniref:YkyB family protein n=1 Tax=Bacillus sp. 165 TaxID=1529117 RepID=UPI001AD9940D|nr:YkyB family protein [Bacillus sp. 165]MBO9130365.1 cytoplasmic protein [Bacillus sp. 165]
MERSHHGKEPTISELSQAVFVVNRHAKAAPDPKFLYWLKKKALEKLIFEKKAQKEGLHFSRNPKFSQQQSDVLVRAGDYFFHIPPSKEDFKTLPHLGELSQTYRNPKTNMSLSLAKKLLQNYVGKEAFTQEHQMKKPQFPWLGKNYFSSKK